MTQAERDCRSQSDGQRPIFRNQDRADGYHLVRPSQRGAATDGLRIGLMMSGHGGEGGIRTPDRLAPMPHFECGAFNHSATSPEGAIVGAGPLWLGALIGEDGGPDKARGMKIRSVFRLGTRMLRPRRCRWLISPDFAPFACRIGSVWRPPCDWSALAAESSGHCASPKEQNPGVGPPDAVNTGGPVPLIEMPARKGGFAGLREATIRP